VGDKRIQASAKNVESEIQLSLGNLLCAQQLCQDAAELNPTMKPSFDELLALILLEKTEYREAHTLFHGILERRSSSKPRIADTVMCELNLAITCIEMGAEVGVIDGHLGAVRTQCTTFVTWASGILSCDAVAAQVQLLQGNIPLAREALERCLSSSQETKDAQVTGFCLTLLADIQNGMHSPLATMKWAVVYLAFGMTTKNKIFTTKALRCIGDLLVTEYETALNLFSAALDAFTFMDIHRDRADCMVRMAEIFESRGEMEKCVDLWRKARPLYERSCQEKEIIKIDAKLRSMAAVLKDDENPLQRLAQLNVPVRALGGTEVTKLDEDSADAERHHDTVDEDMERQKVFV
jgi:tetratricopeptide (TPR) repeat protein